MRDVESEGVEGRASGADHMSGRASRRQQREDDALAALVARVHGDTERRTCASCGVERWSDVTTPLVARNALDGATLQFGRCDDCARAGRRLDRAVVAHRLRLDPHAEVLDYVRLPRFADQPGARPDRPNTEPWQHV